MNVNQMREELAKKYSPAFVKKLKTDAQVTATYLRLKRNNKI